MPQSKHNKPRKAPKRGPKKPMEISRLKRAVLGKLEAGFSFRGAASELSIERNTIRSWRDKDEQFDAACLDARESAIEQVEDVMFRSAIKAEEDARYQTSAIFYLKNRAPSRWRDVRNIRQVNDVQQIIDNMPQDEIDRLADGLPGTHTDQDNLTDGRYEP